ncbi:MAG: helix-turn-helix domain-containing protein [Coprobacillus sp.]
MDSKQIGTQISSARKKMNYIQRELADKIGVSDKAISKWERGAGCPDISLLLPLCEELNIDVSELLGKESINKETEDNQKEEQRLLQFAEYAKMKIVDNRLTILKYITIFLCFASVISIGICLLVDYVLTGTFSWSLTATASIAYGCIIISVFLMCRYYRIEKTLGVSSVLLFPLLYVISFQVELSMFFPKAYVIACGAIALVWMMYGILFHIHISILYRLILISIISTIFNVLINMYTNANTQSIFTLLIANGLGIITLSIIGYICSKKYNSRF